MAHRETSKHLEAFEFWYSANRDFRQTSLKITQPNRTIRDWANWFGWHERADKRDMQAASQAEREAIERKVKMIEDQRKAGQALRTLGVRFLAQNQDKAVSSLRDAISAIEKGFALERQAEGLPDWVGQILNATDDELRDRYNELLRLAPAESSHRE